MQVLFEDAPTKGKAYIGEPDNPRAEMTFSKAGEHLLIIDHTEVQSSLKGKGAGRILLDTVVSRARLQDVKILPLCPYAKSVFDNDPSLADVLK
ncbi:MAG: N-acetyltransferase [Saprospiraceae bacterium]|nr:N-acetyltransferase [Saprospiraceae bacterium]